ncbi:hypothetical protein [Streptomyces mirabilis]|uniref:hypothetical protein n=1 Tax=Streptomyces mirabilis TaxID=68239 RepID=UPI003647A915
MATPPRSGRPARQARRELPGPVDAEHAHHPVHPERAVRPPDTVGHPQGVGAAELTAMAGDAFTEKISTKVGAKAEKAMAEVRVRSAIYTDATFTGGEKVATIPSNTIGVGVAAVLQAGDRARPLPAGGEAPEPCSCE